MARKFGFECELSGGARAVLQDLHASGLATTDYFHEYHCRCSACSYRLRGDVPFFAQADCTADGEIITKILEHGSPLAERAINELARAIVQQKGKVSSGVGLHVHVDATDFEHADRVRLMRIYLRYQDDLAELAAASFKKVRSYNNKLDKNLFHDRYANPPVRAGRGIEPEWHEEAHSPACREGCWRQYEGDLRRWQQGRVTSAEQPKGWWDEAPEEAQYYPLSKGYWIADRDRSFEFRLWNATRSEWRIRLAVGTSVAIADAAKDGVLVAENDERSMVEVLSPYLTDDAWAGILRQYHFKGA